MFRFEKRVREIQIKKVWHDIKLAEEEAVTQQKLETAKKEQAHASRESICEEITLLRDLIAEKGLTTDHQPITPEQISTRTALIQAIQLIEEFDPRIDQL